MCAAGFPRGPRPLNDKRVLLIVGGGIAAYKALELVRLLRKAGVAVRPILTAAGARFVTPLSLGALAEDEVRTELFAADDEAKMGHIELSRSADLVVVVPATADLMAKAAQGRADDLASTTLLATDKPVLMAPAMNVRMWKHPATRRNLALLSVRRRAASSDRTRAPWRAASSAPGRMAEPAAIAEAVLQALAARTGGSARRTPRPRHRGAHGRADRSRARAHQPLQWQAGLRHRRRPGAAGRAGDPRQRTRPRWRRPRGWSASRSRRPCRCWRPARRRCRRMRPSASRRCRTGGWTRPSAVKLKKAPGGPPTFTLVENPDILATLSKAGPHRPRLVVGFAAETNDLEAEAQRQARAQGLRLDRRQRRQSGGDHGRR